MLRRWLASSGPIWVLNFLLAAAAVLLFFGPVDWPEAPLESYLPWWSLAIAFLVAERCVVHLHFKRSAHSFSLGDIPLVFGLLFASAHDLIIGTLIGTSLVLVLDRRLPLIKLVFNLAQFVLGACLRSWSLHWVVPDPSDLGPRCLAGVMLATQASAIVAVAADQHRDLAVGGIDPAEDLRSHADDGPRRDGHEHEPRARRRGDRLATTPARSRCSPFPSRPSSSPTAHTCSNGNGTRGSSSSTRRRGRSRARPRSCCALESLLARSLEAFRAELAEIVLLGSDGSPPLRTTLGPGLRKR